MTEILATGFGLPEGPVYDEIEDRVLVTDASGGGVWAVQLDTGEKSCVVEHRKGIGGLALHADGGYIISGRNLAWKRGDETFTLLDQAFGSPTARYNDITTSPEGGVYAGSIDYDLQTGKVHHLGDLHYVSPTGPSRVVASGIELTNGLGVSPDGSTLYHVDTGPRVLYRYDILDADGSLSERQVVIHLPDGTPDGIAIAASGHVLVAVGCHGAPGFISVVAPNGTEDDRWIMPYEHVTSVCIGGRDGRSVFVTMGGTAKADERLGVVARIDQQVEGLPRPRARVRPV